MEVKRTREEYEKVIHEAAGQMAQLLENGYSVEVATSRSGLKLYKIKKTHEMIRRQISPDKRG